MTIYSYKVVPAPVRARKRPGVKAPEALFALALEEAINDMSREGWEYLRADMLPSEERAGLFSTRTVQRSVMIFRRAMTAADAQAAQDAAQSYPAPPAHAPASAAPAPATPAMQRPAAPQPAEQAAPRAAPSLGAAAAGSTAYAEAPLRRTPPLTAQVPERGHDDAEQEASWSRAESNEPRTYQEYDPEEPAPGSPHSNS